MAKTTPTPSIAATPSRSIDELRFNDQVQVIVREGAYLLNNETGAYFEQGVATPVTVTPTLMRRLQDGDLVLA